MKPTSLQGFRYCVFCKGYEAEFILWEVKVHFEVTMDGFTLCAPAQIQARLTLNSSSVVQNEHNSSMLMHVLQTET